MKEANVNTAARKEMAEEKARIMKRKKEGFSLLEQIALAWKKKEEGEKGRRAEQERKVRREQDTPVISVQKIPAQVKALHNETDGAIQWGQFSPFKKEKRGPGRLNGAGIRGVAKRLMAKEWARALGRRGEDPRMLALEQEAAEHRKRKEEERKKAEEEKVRVEKQKEILEREAAEHRKRKEEEKRRAEQERKRIQQQTETLQNLLKAFGEKLLQKKESITSEGTAKLFEEVLESVGEIMEINWTENGCETYVEPWEEKRLRRKRRDSLPVIYKVEINEMLEVVSYGRVD